MDTHTSYLSRRIGFSVDIVSQQSSRCTYKIMYYIKSSPPTFWLHKNNKKSNTPNWKKLIVTKVKFNMHHALAQWRNVHMLAFNFNYFKILYSTSLFYYVYFKKSIKNQFEFYSNYEFKINWQILPWYTTICSRLSL